MDQTVNNQKEGKHTRPRIEPGQEAPSTSTSASTASFADSASGVAGTSSAAPAAEPPPTGPAVLVPCQVASSVGSSAPPLPKSRSGGNLVRQRSGDSHVPSTPASGGGGSIHLVRGTTAIGISGWMMSGAQQAGSSIAPSVPSAGSVPQPQTSSLVTGQARKQLGKQRNMAKQKSLDGQGSSGASTSFGVGGVYGGRKALRKQVSLPTEIERGCSHRVTASSSPANTVKFTGGASSDSLETPPGTERATPTGAPSPQDETAGTPSTPQASAKPRLSQPQISIDPPDSEPEEEAVPPMTIRMTRMSSQGAAGGGKRLLVRSEAIRDDTSPPPPTLMGASHEGDGDAAADGGEGSRAETATTAPVGVAALTPGASPSTLSPDAALVVDPGTSHRRAQFLKQHSSQQSDDSSHSAGGYSSCSPATLSPDAALKIEDPTTSSRRRRLLKQSSSQQSDDTSTTSSLSRDSSFEYKDSSGCDLEEFIKYTLVKNAADRRRLLQIEQELINFIRDPNRKDLQFPRMSSYNRMLVHRTSAFFGCEHNVDKSGHAVVVNKTPLSRIPEVRFKEWIPDDIDLTEGHHPPRKILTRDSTQSSFEDDAAASGGVAGGGGVLRSPDRSLLNQKSKSFEEREAEYVEARKRIFNQDSLSSAELDASGMSRETSRVSSCCSSKEDLLSGCGSSGSASCTFGSSSTNVGGRRALCPQSSTDSSGYGTDTAHFAAVVGGGVVGRGKGRPPMTKASSFGGTVTLLCRGDSLDVSPTGPPAKGKLGGPSILFKPSVFVHSPSPEVTPITENSPTENENDVVVTTTAASVQSVETRHTTVSHVHVTSSSVALNGFPCRQPVIWAVTDVNAVPSGSILINPQNGQPYVNTDGSLYRYDPSNPLPFPAMTTSSSNHHLSLKDTHRGDSTGSTDLSEAISSVTLTPQSSLESQLSLDRNQQGQRQCSTAATQTGNGSSGSGSGGSSVASPTSSSVNVTAVPNQTPNVKAALSLASQQGPCIFIPAGALTNTTDQAPPDDCKDEISVQLKENGGKDESPSVAGFFLPISAIGKHLAASLQTELAHAAMGSQSDATQPSAKSNVAPNVAPTLVLKGSDGTYQELPSGQQVIAIQPQILTQQHPQQQTQQPQQQQSLPIQPQILQNPSQVAPPMDSFQEGCQSCDASGLAAKSNQASAPPLPQQQVYLQQIPPSGEALQQQQVPLAAAAFYPQQMTSMAASSLGAQQFQPHIIFTNAGNAFVAIPPEAYVASAALAYDHTTLPTLPSSSPNTQQQMTLNKMLSSQQPQPLYQQQQFYPPSSGPSLQQELQCPQNPYPAVPNPAQGSSPLSSHQAPANFSSSSSSSSSANQYLPQIPVSYNHQQPLPQFLPSLPSFVPRLANNVARPNKTADHLYDSESKTFQIQPGFAGGLPCGNSGSESDTLVTSKSPSSATTQSPFSEQNIASNGNKLFHPPFPHPAGLPPRPTSTPPSHFPSSVSASSTYVLDEIVRPNSQPSVSSQIGGPNLPGGPINLRQPLSYPPVVYPYGTPSSVAGVFPPYQYLAAVAAAAAAAPCSYPTMDPGSVSVQQQVLQQQMFYQQQMLQYQSQLADSLASHHVMPEPALQTHPPVNTQTHPPALYGAAMGCSTDAESIATSEVLSLEESVKSPDSSTDGLVTTEGQQASLPL